VAEYEASLSNHVGAIESDLGAGHPLGFTGIFSPSARASLQQITRVLSPIGATLVDAGTGAADVNAMARRGVPVFGLMQDERMYFNYHHTAADTLDKIDPHELAENAAAMAVLGFALADMPQSLPR
jgi:carboxypeptidase Q